MRQRLLRRRVQTLLRQFPAVALVGPRQSGKTTLAKMLGERYFDLEQEADRLRLDAQWDEVTASSGITILDEAQAYPELSSRLRGTIDQNRKLNGRFLLLGSVSPRLIRNASESLAGRLALCELTPFLAKELPKSSMDRLWLAGGYPDGGILSPRRFPDWQKHYMEILTQRDLPNWGLSARPQVTWKFLKLLTAYHGTLWNASQLSRDMGLSYPTINAYMDYLEGAFLIRRLAPFHANMRKRLVKSPKMFWRDSGLAHAMAGVYSMDQLWAHLGVGRSWEGFVIEQILSHLSAWGKHFEPYFFRTSDGMELDLILEFSGKRWAFEIKLSSSPGAEDFKKLSLAADLVKAEKRILVSRAATPIMTQNLILTNLSSLLTLLKACPT